MEGQPHRMMADYDQEW